MWNRREFIGGVVLAGASAAIGRRRWAGGRSHASVSPAAPYGPLGEPDAHGIRVPSGFRSRIVARTGEPVAGHVWHVAPDGGACFAAADGGWIYVSNSEVPNGAGGASAVRFDRGGAIVAAYSILSGTSMNCAGGGTSWGTWLSCEEAPDGRVHECDPFGPGQGVVRPNLGTFAHEAAAEDPETGCIYLSEDDPDGRLYRFVPAVAGDLRTGRLEAASLSDGVVTWVPVAVDAPERSPATTAFDGGEGLIVDGRTLYLTTKGDHRIWTLSVDTGRMSVLFDGSATSGPLTVVDNVAVHRPSGDVYVAEDGGDMELVQIVQVAGEVFAHPVVQFVGHDASEVAGPAFSPAGDRLYVSSQRGTDGLAGWTIEVSGPFRITRAPGAASVSGLAHPDRLGAIEIGRPAPP